MTASFAPSTRPISPIGCEGYEDIDKTFHDG